MPKKFSIFNEEPNVNILGINPILKSLMCDEWEKLCGFRFSVISYEFSNGTFRAGSVTEEWDAKAARLLDRIEKDPRFEQLTFDKAKEYGRQIHDFCFKTLDRLAEGKLSEKQRLKAIKKIFELYELICVYGLVGPVVELKDQILSQKLDQALQAKLGNPKKMAEALGLLIFEPMLNFDQQAFIDLCKIVQPAFDDQKFRVLFEKPAGEIPELLPRAFLEKIDKHVGKWSWLNYSYCGPEADRESVLREIRGILSLDLSPEMQAKRIKEEISANSKKQNALIEELKLNDWEIYLAKIAKDFTFTKYFRAKMMFLACFTANKLLKPLAAKEGLSFNQLGACTVKEIFNYLDGGRLPEADILNQRLKFSVLLTRPDGEVFLLGDLARAWVKENVQEVKIDLALKELAGQIACTGGADKITGRVKIVHSAKDMADFKEGDILISTSTTPEIVPAMKMAAAIISDTGGLTCHAAIVSRELNKPCIIGTKIATKVFKDGDRVEVDAEKGIVKKL